MAKNRKNRGKSGGMSRRDQEERGQRSQGKEDRGAQPGPERNRERDESRGESRSGVGQGEKGRRGEDR
jgi:hypothetical protein